MARRKEVTPQSAVEIVYPSGMKHDAGIWKFVGDCAHKVITEDVPLPRAFARGRWRVEAEQASAHVVTLAISVIR